MKNIIIGLLLILLILNIADSSFIHSFTSVQDFFKQFMMSMDQLPYPQNIAAKMIIWFSIITAPIIFFIYIFKQIRSTFPTKDNRSDSIDRKNKN